MAFLLIQLTICRNNYQPTVRDFPEYGTKNWVDISADCENLRAEMVDFLTPKDERGEMFIRPDVLEILSLFSNLGFALELKTNRNNLKQCFRKF